MTLPMMDLYSTCQYCDVTIEYKDDIWYAEDGDSYCNNNNNAFEFFCHMPPHDNQANITLPFENNEIIFPKNTLLIGNTLHMTVDVDQSMNIVMDATPDEDYAEQLQQNMYELVDELLILAFDMLVEHKILEEDKTDTYSSKELELCIPVVLKSIETQLQEHLNIAKANEN